MTFNNLLPAFCILTSIEAAGTTASVVAFASFYQSLAATDPSMGA